MYFTRYSLCAVEENVGVAWTGATGQTYHSFLALVNRTQSQKPEIISEINFVAVDDGIIAHQHKRWKEGQDLERDYTSRDIILGTPDFMLEVWDKAVHNSRVISSLKLPFARHSCGAEALNCRAAVKGVIQSLGLEYFPVIEGDEAIAGTQANIVHLLPPHMIQSIEN